MKATVAVKPFREAVNKAQRATDEKSAINALSHLWVEAKDSSIKVCGNDLEAAIEVVIEAEVEREGVLILPAKPLSSYAGLLSGDKLEIEADGEKAKLKCGKSRGRIAGLGPDNFPAWDKEDPEGEIVIPDWARLHKLTAFTVSKDESRYTLQAMLIEQGDGRATAVSTDGHRMSCLGFASDAPPAKILIARSGVELAKILTGEVRLSWDKSSVTLDDGDTRIRVRKSAGQFTDWRRLIPKPGDALTVNLGDLDQAVRRVAVLGEVRQKAVTCVKLAVKDGSLKASSDTPDGGASEEIACEGPGVVVMMDARYLHDILGRVSDEAGATLELTDDGGGIGRAVIRSEDYAHVLMGIRV